MRVVRVCVFPRPKRAAMSAARDVGSSAARRRWERRLRSFLCPRADCGRDGCGGGNGTTLQGGQATATAVSEVEEQVKYYAPLATESSSTGVAASLVG